jgi:hypothetical protein
MRDLIIAAVDQLPDDDPGKYERLVKERDQAEAQLKAQLLPQAKKTGVPVEQLMELVKMKHREPQEFARLHRVASQIAADEEARLLKLKSTARHLAEVIQSESKTEDPFRLHRARVDLDKLNALIKKMEQQ